MAQALPYIIAAAAAGGAIASAEAQKSQLDFQAKQQDFQADVEAVRAKQEQNKVREALLRTIAKNRAAAFGSGIDAGSSSIQAIQQSAIANAVRLQTNIERNSQFQQSALRQSASLARSQGQAARRIGIVQAIGAAGQAFVGASGVGSPGGGAAPAGGASNPGVATGG